MSSSKCPHCQNNSFELSTEAPYGSKYKLTFIRCKSCKTVVGVMDYYNIGTLIYKLAEKLRIKLD